MRALVRLATLLERLRAKLAAPLAAEVSLKRPLGADERRRVPCEPQIVGDASLDVACEPPIVGLRTLRLGVERRRVCNETMGMGDVAPARREQQTIRL
ncbi:MAG: hypothetical protein ACYCWW_17415 [Deltaproteobacteria bacterium]